jgi:hypothetical protein
MDDLFEKKMHRAKGQTRKKKVGGTFVLHTVPTKGRYIMSGSWKKYGMQERAEQRWRPLRRARAPSSMVHACFPSPAAAPLPRYVTWAIFWTMSRLEISVSKLILLTLSALTMSVSVSTVMWGCGIFDSTLSCFGFLLEMKAKLWLCSVVLAGRQSPL